MRYCRTSSMPEGMLFPYPTPSRHAISPYGLHCVAARYGATIASLLRSLSAAIRLGEDAAQFSDCQPAW